MTEKTGNVVTLADWLGLGFRLAAIYPLWLALVSLNYFVYELATRSPYAAGDFDSMSRTPQAFLLQVVLYSAEAALLLRGAPLLVRFAYPSPSEDETPDKEPMSPSHEGDAAR